MTPDEHRHERLLVGLTMMLVMGIGALDRALPSETSAVTLYVIPILLSLLSTRQWFTLAVTIISLSLATLGFRLGLSDESGGWVAPTNRALALVVTTAVACLILFYRRLTDEERAATARRLEQGGAEPAVGLRLLPICSSCKNIRNGDGSWTYLETYLKTRWDAHCTHGLCPDCQKKLRDSIATHDREQPREPLLTR